MAGCREETKERPDDGDGLAGRSDAQEPPLNKGVFERGGIVGRDGEGNSFGWWRMPTERGGVRLYVRAVSGVGWRGGQPRVYGGCDWLHTLRNFRRVKIVTVEIPQTTDFPWTG